MLSGRARLLTRPRLLHAARPTTSSAPREEVQQEIDRCYASLDKSFADTQKAYLSKSNYELLRGLLVLRICSFKPIVHYNQVLIKLSQRLLGKRAFEWLLRHSFYGHFVAGANETEIEPVIRRMKGFGVKAILDYSVEADLSQDEARQKTQDSVGQDGIEAAKVIGSEEEADKLEPFKHIKRYKANIEEFGDRRKGAVVRTYFYSGEPECDRNMETFLKSIEGTAKATEGTGFVAVKLTALGRPQLLLQLSEVIAQTQKFYQLLTGSTWEDLVHAKLSKAALMDKMQEYGVKTDTSVVEVVSVCMMQNQHLETVESAFQKFFETIDFDKNGVYNIKNGELEPLIKPMSEEENQQFDNMIRRVHTIAEYADNLGVRMMIDAEQTYFQPAIGRLALELMRKYNRTKPLIFNTYQAYLKATPVAMALDMHLARRENFHFGAKLVRGAYLEQERERSAVMGYEDPVNPDYDATTATYHRCLGMILDEWQAREPEKVSVLVATHNEDSVRFAVDEMKRRRIDPSAKVCCFGQLYGMCDQVSFSLGQAGFSVYKYVPYGPVLEVLPYLSRRALENNAIFEKANKERQLMWSELKRRWRTGEKGGQKGPLADVSAIA